MKVLTEHKGNWVEQTVIFIDFITRVTHSESGEWIQSVSEFPLGKNIPRDTVLRQHTLAGTVCLP